MATVSILIPAFKADYLGRALISAQRQTFEDIEILVGDDTAVGELKEVVARSNDPRIQYFHHGFQDGALNSKALWDRASGQYVKWLYDDDMLMPTSVEALVAALREHPDSALAFHERVFIDGNDAVVHIPPASLKVGERGLLDRSALVTHMVGNLNNFIGEPSNVMLVRDRVDPSRMLAYRAWELDFLCDVAMYLNLAENAPLVAVGGYLSAFRRHAAQVSSGNSPNWSAGLYEWELMVRGEAAAGNLPAGALATAQQCLRNMYTNGSGRLPELARLLANLDELTQRPAHELLDSERFQADLAYARAAVAERKAARVRQPAPISTPVPAAAPAPAPAQNFCAVCESPVQQWLPQQAGHLDLEFLLQIGSVGSTLHKYMCPNCGCNDRDRHLWLYLAFTGLLEDASAKRILHIAPEARIEPRIRKLQPREYIAGDLYPRSPQHHRINVEALDFPTGYFDLIICNHVLEHVDNPEAALAEFSRCLAQGGHLVAQTPYSTLLKHTFELNKPATSAFKTRYFGQDDHVRMFGADIADYFRAAGLNGDLYPHEAVLADIDADVWGCNEHEPLFLFAKGESPTLADAAGKADGKAQDSAQTDATGHVPVPAAAPSPFAELPNAILPRERKPVRLVVATRHTEAHFMTETALGRSLALYSHEQPPQLQLFASNTTGLPALYNAAIEQAATSPAILVFVHDDVSIGDFFWVERIHEAVRQFDVVGLAGNMRRTPRQPSWAFTPDLTWDRREFLSGVVGHGKGFPCEIVSNFGPAGVECKLLDGLMLIADSAQLVESGVRFDEQFDFHFYDMDFCRQAEVRGLRMGTWPISVVHESGGAFDSPPWRAGYQRYLQKYGE